MKPKGLVMYRGPSQIDGQPIVVVATLKSSNRKTGDMVQTWILRENLHPVEASKRKDDVSICGNCPHRHATGGSCYVNIGQAPASIWKSYRAGKYPSFDAEKHSGFFAGRKVRLGAYGDPAAMPFNVAQQMVYLSDGHTGYTHQAGRKFFDNRFLTLCQASADTPKQAVKLQQNGAKTFRVALKNDRLMPGEIECLSDTKGMSCLECGLCDGVTKNVMIRVHGSRASRFKSARVAA